MSYSKQFHWLMKITALNPMIRLTFGEYVLNKDHNNKINNKTSNTPSLKIPFCSNATTKT